VKCVKPALPHRVCRGPPSIPCGPPPAFGEDSAATKLKSMIYFYLDFPVHVSMAKQNIDAEKTLFAVCIAGCIVIHVVVCKDLSWSTSSISYLVQFHVLGGHIRFN